MRGGGDSNTPGGSTALGSPEPPLVATAARSVLRNIRDSLMEAL